MEISYWMIGIVVFGSLVDVLQFIFQIIWFGREWRIKMAKKKKTKMTKKAKKKKKKKMKK